VLGKLFDLCCVDMVDTLEVEDMQVLDIPDDYIVVDTQKDDLDIVVGIRQELLQVSNVFALRILFFYFGFPLFFSFDFYTKDSRT